MTQLASIGRLLSAEVRRCAGNLPDNLHPECVLRHSPPSMSRNWAELAAACSRGMPLFIMLLRLVVGLEMVLRRHPRHSS